MMQTTDKRKTHLEGYRCPAVSRRRVTKYRLRALVKKPTCKNCRKEYELNGGRL